MRQELEKVIRAAERATLALYQDEATSLGISPEACAKIAQQKARVERMQQARKEALLRFGVPLSSHARRSLVLGKPQDTLALRHAAAWWKTKTPLLILAGGVGVGKTYAAAAIATKARGGKIVPASMLARLMRVGFDREPLSLTLGYMVLDDLGSEALTESWREAFGEFIDVRAQAYRTIITTNLAPEALQARYGERAWDRLRGATIVTVTGVSLRPTGERVSARRRT